MDAFFLKYTLWCLLNSIVIHPTKSNFLLFNSSNITVNINGHFLDNPKVVKYLGLYNADKLFWNYQVKHITQLISQRMFGRVLPCLPNFVAILYYNTFFRSCFSYCLMFWFNNDLSGKCELINKIEG